MDLGAGEILLTSMDTDGHQGGYDLPLTAAVSSAVPIPVIASGGVGKVDDIETLARLEVPARAVGSGTVGSGDGGPARRLSGAISGKALVDGRMTVEEGVAACERFG